MGKHRDDGEMSHKSHAEHEKSHKSGASNDGGALGPDEGTPRKKRSDIEAPKAGGGDGGALGPDEGTARADAPQGKHAEFGHGKHEHSPHMPGQADEPNC